MLLRHYNETEKKHTFVGDAVGLAVGELVGLPVGDAVGDLLGDVVGDVVGFCAHIQTINSMNVEKKSFNNSNYDPTTKQKQNIPS